MMMVERERRVDHVAKAERLRLALDRGELDLRYQPIHQLSTGRVVAAEALLRWRADPAAEGDGIEQLTSAAERGEELFDLAHWVAHKAVTDARSWPEGTRVNINLSSRQVQERDLLDFVDRWIDELQFDPTSVNLEITEKSFIHKPREVVGLLDELRRRGFNLWLDDFGTGHSSIEHLRYFPVEGLKIPSMYTRDILEDERSHAIVRGMISMARSLELKIVAEGVETIAQLDLLRKAGVDGIQGFYFSRPLPCDRLVDYARDIEAQRVSTAV